MAEEVDMDPLIDACVEMIAALFSVMFLIADRVLWALWNNVVKMFSMDHLGQSPAIIFFSLGLLFCLWFYVMKFWVE